MIALEYFISSPYYFTNLDWRDFNKWNGLRKTNILKKNSNSNRHNKKTIILMIDDEEICLLSMELMLFNSPYTLITANTGTKGLEYINENLNDIDLIFLDLMLPDIHGLSVLEEIKKHPIANKIPVILQTSVINAQEIFEASKLGIANHLTKPYRKEDILKVIEKSLNSNC